MPDAGRRRVGSGACRVPGSVMISKLQNVETPGFDPIHKAVLIGDAARPVALPAVLERLGFADASERVPADILGQGVNSRQHSRACLAPPSQVLLCLVGVEWLTGGDGRGARFLFRRAHGRRATARHSWGCAE